jgi:uncharacterized membrane protein
MSELIVIGYPTEELAKDVLDRAEAAEHDHLVDLDQVAIAVMDTKGRLHLTTVDHVAERKIFGNVFWGVLIGMLLVIPLSGVILGGAAVLGGAIGGIVGLVDQLGIRNDFKKQLANLIQPGTSALFLVVEESSADNAVLVLSHSGGTVLRTTLDKDAEEKLREALVAAPVAA